MIGNIYNVIRIMGGASINNEVSENRLLKNDRLRDAILSKDITTINVLIRNGMDINDTFGYNALISAIMENHYEITKLLLENGANINYHGFMTKDSDKYYWTPLIYAVHYDYRDIVKLLLEFGADVKVGLSDYLPQQLLYESACNNNIIIFKKILKHNSLYNLNSNRMYIINIFKIARLKKHTKIIQLLQKFLTEQIPLGLPEDIIENIILF